MENACDSAGGNHRTEWSFCVRRFLDLAGDGPGATWDGKFGHPTELLPCMPDSVRSAGGRSRPRTAEALKT